MAGTMKKEDVKLSYDDITRIDWNEVKTVAGKAVPQLAKNVAADLCKKLKHKEIRKPYAKVGLIGADLFIRFKDGQTHLDEVLLVKAWTDPGAAQEKDPAYLRRVDEFIQTRKELLAAVTQGEKIIKTQYNQLEALREQAEELAKLAERASKKGTPDETAVPAAQKLAQSAQRLMASSQDHFDGRVHPPMEEHRGISTVEGIDSGDISDWGKNWFLQNVNPKYQKAVDYLRLSETALQQILDAKSAVDRWTISTEDPLDNYARAAEKVKAALEKELAFAKRVWAMSPIEDFAYGLRADLESIEGFIENNQWDFAQRTIDNASGKAAKASDNFKLVSKHLAKLQDAAQAIEKIPTSAQKNGKVKPHCDGVKQLLRDAKAYDKECQGHLKEGLKVFEKIKKLQQSK